ncbi:MAG: phosphoribosylanthranilate isomerase [Pseudomonadota bacterium]
MRSGRTEAVSIEVKICGLNDPDAVIAAAEGGARYLGFMFYPRSPRAVTPARAAELAALVPDRCAKVGVVVDSDDQLIDDILDDVPLDYLQLHGEETPERVAAIKARTGCFTIKALQIADEADLESIAAYSSVADKLLLDAKPPSKTGSLPGGNGLSFDWRLLSGRDIGHHWLLAGGLSADNLAAAVTLCAAPAVDVSSGVEQRPGHKDPAKIRQFLDLAASLDLPG